MRYLRDDTVRKVMTDQQHEELRKKFRGDIQQFNRKLHMLKKEKIPDEREEERSKRIRKDMEEFCQKKRKDYFERFGRDITKTMLAAALLYDEAYQVWQEKRAIRPNNNHKQTGSGVRLDCICRCGGAFGLALVAVPRKVKLEAP